MSFISDLVPGREVHRLGMENAGFAQTHTQERTQMHSEMESGQQCCQCTVYYNSRLHQGCHKDSHDFRIGRGYLRNWPIRIYSIGKS